MRKFITILPKEQDEEVSPTTSTRSRSPINRTQSISKNADSGYSGTDTESAETDSQGMSTGSLAGLVVDGKTKETAARKKFSLVWNYFKKSKDKKFAKCNTCGREYKTSGNTTNLHDHLQRFHPAIIRNNEPANSESSTTSSSARSSIRSVSPFFKRSFLYDLTSKRRRELDKSLISMICMDFQPFSIVDDKGFKQFVHLLDPRYSLPSTYTLSNKLLKEQYLEGYKILKKELEQVEFVAITTDSWTSRNTDSYLTVTCQYIFEWKLKTAVLSTKPLENGINHTSENLCNALKDILEEWEIYNKVTCVVTDNAANMVKACELLQKKHMPCFAHTINLAVQDNLKHVSAIIQKVKNIVTFFKHSSVATETLKKEQSASEKQPLKLIQDCPTRWNSTLYMVERILETNESLGRALLKLRKAPSPLTLEDIAVLKDIKNLLESFEDATRKISGTGYVTISLIIPISFGIFNFLNSIGPLTEEGKQLRCGLIESVKRRLFPYETRTITKISTLLDPRFKKEGFRNPENSESSAILLEKEMSMIPLASTSTNDFLASNSEPSSANNKKSLFSFVQERILEKSKSATKDVIITKRQYLERANLDQNADPLLFWKMMESELSRLDKCALKFFCTPGSSVDSERMFSSAGQVVSERRSRLKHESINMLTFLHKNMNL